jgi:hypothetical protein
MQSKEMTLCLPTFMELFDGLPAEHQTDAIRRPLLDAYNREVMCLLLTAISPACQKPAVQMSLWREAGSQQIAEFSVSDTALPRTSEMNWHMQNTSQWVYAGAIVVQNGEVSTHH